MEITIREAERKIELFQMRWESVRNPTNKSEMLERIRLERDIRVLDDFVSQEMRQKQKTSGQIQMMFSCF